MESKVPEDGAALQEIFQGAVEEPAAPHPGHRRPVQQEGDVRRGQHRVQQVVAAGEAVQVLLPEAGHLPATAAFHNQPLLSLHRPQHHRSCSAHAHPSVDLSILSNMISASRHLSKFGSMGRTRCAVMHKVRPVQNAPFLSIRDTMPTVWCHGHAPDGIHDESPRVLQPESKSRFREKKFLKMLESRMIASNLLPL